VRVGMATEVHHPRDSGGSRPLAERLLAFFRPTRPPTWRVTVERQLSESAVQQVVGREPADGCIVGSKIVRTARRIVPASTATKADHGESPPAHRQRDLVVVEIGDDPIAIPLAQLGKLLERVLLHIQTPPILFPHVGSHALNHAPVETARDVSQHGNSAGAAHGGSPVQLSLRRSYQIA